MPHFNPLKYPSLLKLLLCCLYIVFFVCCVVCIFCCLCVVLFVCCVCNLCHTLETMGAKHMFLFHSLITPTWKLSISYNYIAFLRYLHYLRLCSSADLVDNFIGKMFSPTTTLQKTIFTANCE